MAKIINLTYDEKEYTLEYTRKSIETMERQGFVIRDLDRTPMSSLPTLFAGAFLAHHRNIRPDVIENIFKSVPNKDMLFEKLSEMYREPFETLMADPDESEGNATWGANW